MTIQSVNEPQKSRELIITPQSINEPLPVPTEWPAPVITSINPTELTIGGPSARLYVTGERFYPGSIIFFAGHTEPTTFEADGTLSTLIDMAYWHGPDTVQVSIYNGDKASNEVDFTFLPAAAPETAHARADADHDPGVASWGDDPDELEEEIEAAEEDGDFKPVHRATVTKTLSNKRSKAVLTKR